MTVLIADAVGSTAFTERAGDEAAYRFAQGWLAEMSKAIERNSGTIIQFRGDGLIALFGAPIAQERSAVAAVTAALEIQAALPKLGGECEFRIGLSTGPVVVGRVGEDVLLDYTAIGDTSNVAARMEQNAEAGSVYISEGTWRAVREYVDCEPIGELQVKGRVRPVAAYRAVRRRAIRTRLEASVERGLGPFVGRAREVDLLLAMVDELPLGKGHVAEITGEAGIGKSRLLFELRQRVPESVGWSEGHCSVNSEDAPYLPIANLLRNAFAIEEHDDPGAVVARIDAASTDWSQEARRAVPYLKYVLDVDPGTDVVAATDARQRRAGIVDALRVAITDAGRRQPRVIVIEDVHWADSSSLDALRALADTVTDIGVLLLTTSRPGYASPFGDSARHTRLALDSLTPEASIAITAGLLEVTDVPPDVAALIAQRAEGNPLFVEELTSTLVESGVLVADGAACRLTMAARDVDVPSSVQDVILARIDRLDGKAREALQLASVIGREFTVRLLDRLATIPDGLDGVLDELKAVELIRQTAWFPELAYLFKHALTHEVTYATLLDERRRSLHRLVAQAIEEVYVDRRAEQIENLARHWLVAEEWAKALGYAEQAADSAAATFSNDVAVRFYEQAIELSERVGDLGLAVSLYERLGAIHLTTSDLSSAVEMFDRMASVATRANDWNALSWALAYRGETFCFLHDWEQGESCLLAAIDVAGASTAPRLYAATSLRSVRGIFGRHDESVAVTPIIDALEAEVEEDTNWVNLGHLNISALLPHWRGENAACLDLVDLGKLVHPDLLALQGVSWVLSLAQGEIGRYDDALATLDTVIAQSTVAGEVFFCSRAINTVGWIRGDLGDRAGCVEWNERCLAFLRAVDMPDQEVESNARLNLAESYLSMGDLPSAARELERVEHIVRGKPIRGTWMLWRYSQRLHLLTARLQLGSGQVSAIGTRIDDCVALAESSGSPKYLGKAAHLRGRILLAENELDGAVDQGELALKTAAQMRHPPDVWRAHELLADIARGRDDRDAERFHLGEADDTLAAVEADLRDAACLAGVRRLRLGLVRS